MIRITAVIALAATLSAQGTAPAPKSPFVVHEWGTFTSMVGSDGLVLEGLQHEEERLPGFVHELASLEAIAGSRGRVLKFPATRVTQKMETPVIYFHTAEPKSNVRVTVEFPKGLLTQFYPIPMLIAPTIDRQRKTPIDLSKIGDSFMQWNVDLIPYGSKPPKEIPQVDSEDPWAFAREVRAAYVRTHDPKGIQRATEAEHYLFYRGLARFALPFDMQVDTNDRGSFRNKSKHNVPFAAVLDMNEDGGRFREVGAVESGKAVKFSFRGMKRDGDRKRVAAALGARVFDALIDEGLYEDEARAMIATWSRSWFQSNGTRVIYVLPRKEVDRVLPLRIKPKPDQTVRVLVGRMEYITPEAETAIESALEARTSANEQERALAADYMASLDRFLEPHVRRALAKSTSVEVQRSAREVLADIARIEQ